jgi:broad specificity phosphatase PhoE
LERLILARHGESVFSARLLVNGDVAVPGPLTARGRDEAEALGRALADEPIDLCATSEFERTRETADLALAGREVPRLVLADLNDPRYGSYEGGALEDYRTWAASVGSDATAPGGGESRHAIVARYARGFRALRERAEQTVLAVLHSLPIAYMLAARQGDPPGRRVPLVAHAQPYPFAAGEVDRALEVLDAWLGAPTW